MFTRFPLCAVFLALLAACAPRPPAPAPASPKPETTNQKPQTDLHGVPLPPGAIARMGTVRLMHGGAVLGVAFSPEGKTLASGTADSTIHLWEVATGKELLRLRGHEDYVLSVAFSPDGRTLASGSKDRTIRLWEVATGMELFSLVGHEGSVYSVAFSPDGIVLASAGEDMTIRLWDVASGKQLIKFGGHERHVFSVAFSSDGITLASGSGDSTIRLWDLATGLQILKLSGHEDYIRPVALSPDGKMLASGSEDTTVLIWDVSPARVTPAASAGPVKRRTLENLWGDLAGVDAGVGYSAIGEMSEAGAEGVAFMIDQLKRESSDEPTRRIAELIAKLEDGNISAREKATVDLKELGVVAEPLLLGAMDKHPSAEAKLRIEGILAPLERPLPIPAGEPLCRHRAIQVLERIGTSEAREALELLAKESPSQRERREARAARERLGRRQDTR